MSLVFCFSIIPSKFVIVISFASYFRLHNVSHICVHFPHLLFLLFGIASSAVSFLVLYMGFRASLSVRKFKVALNPMYRILLKFAKQFILSCLSKFYNKKNFTVPFLKYKRLKLKLKVFLAGHSVAIATCCVTNIIPTCSPVRGGSRIFLSRGCTTKDWRN